MGMPKKLVQVKEKDGSIKHEEKEFSREATDSGTVLRIPKGITTQDLIDALQWFTSTHNLYRDLRAGLDTRKEGELKFRWEMSPAPTKEQLKQSPITDDLLVAYPRICPDVAILHVQRCDEYGNCQINGINAIDILLAKSSRRVIVTTEKILPTEDFMSAPSSTDLPSTFVDTVVESPFGAHPTSCFPYYTYDLWHLLHYIEISKKGKTENYIKQHITDLESFESYLNLIKDDVKRVIVREP